MAKKSKRAAQGEAQRSERTLPDYVPPADPPRATLAVHPAGHAVALAVGPELRVYDARTQRHLTLVSKPEGEPASAKGAKPAVPIVRSLAFDAAGRHLLAGTEHKADGLRVWHCATWELVHTVKVPKKVTSVAFTPDGAHVLAADKFGDVLAASTTRPAGLPEGQQQEPELLLGHFCAILTSLSLSAGGRLLATTDRDHRVRVSVMPADPLAGAHEIQSFCQGHTAFVTCSTFVQQGGQELLVSGGGDGTLRLWDPLTGRLLHTLELPPLHGAGGSDEEAGDAAAEAAATPAEAAEMAEEAAAEAPVPLALAASPDGGWLVAAVDQREELCLVQLDWGARRLCERGWSALAGLHLPACLAFDAGGRLWAAGGPVADASTAAFLACGAVAPDGARLADAPPPDWLPAEAARRLEARAGDEAAHLAAADESRRLASQLLRRRRYSLQQLEHRKRNRRDRVAAEQQQQGKQGEQEAN